jgi:hypothetical protein
MPEETPEFGSSSPETSTASPSNPETSLKPITPRSTVQYGSEPAHEDSSRTPYVAFIAFAGWLVPGLGHLFQRRWGRAAIGFVAVGTMALAGLWMRGNVFAPQRGDAFGLLGFIADAGAGVFYLLAHTFQKAGADVSHAAGDYGTRMLATAGVLNLLFVLDALEVSRGKKN